MEPTTTSTAGTASHPTPTRLAALDGLRAIAVVAVVLYHVDHDAVPGGFVGVDLFFVLSGYLITTLLLLEHGRTGAVSLRHFWGRRIRRLWPLAWITLGAIAVASLAGVWGDDRQRTLPAELAASIGQIANWYQAGHGGYLRSAVAPTPVRHFWSLAIEEQFYVIWPLVLVGLLAVAGRRRWAVPTALAALAALSIAAGWWHADAPDRAYLGTDVRAVALVAGAGLAWVLRDRPMAGPSGRRGRIAVAVAGPIGLVVLGASVVTLHGDSDLLPRGGFAVIAAASAALIAFALSPTGLARGLGWAPIAWLGRVSFAVYLVHWPLLVALGPDRSVWLRLVVALPVSIAIAAVLHRVVERPLIARTVPRVGVTGGAAALVAASVAALIVSVPTGATPTERIAPSLEEVPDPTTTVAAPPPAGVTTTTCVPAAGATPGTSPDDISASEDALADPTGAACSDQVVVLVVGDSTGRGTANGLSALADPRMVVWDRTVLGCSFGGEDCPDWRNEWRTAVDTIRPDVVLLYSGVVEDLHGVDDSGFLSPTEREARAAAFDEALALLSSQGARVLFTVPAVPLRPLGLYFCDGRGRGSPCDPAWVTAWTSDVAAATMRSGATLVDVAAWAATRGTTDTDRPDGVHYSAALRAQAEWLVPQLLTAAAG